MCIDPIHPSLPPQTPPSVSAPSSSQLHVHFKALVIRNLLSAINAVRVHMCAWPSIRLRTTYWCLQPQRTVTLNSLL